MATSPLSAHSHDRERLAPLGLILGLALGVLLTLAILFDPQVFMARIRANGHGAVTLYFMKALLASTNSNHLRLLLVRREIQAGHYHQALLILEPLITTPAARQYRPTIRWLTYSDLLATTFSYPTNSPERRNGIRKLRLMIPALRTEVHGAELSKLALGAINLHDGLIAIPIFKGLAIRHPRRRALYYGFAAQAALSLNANKEAATLYFTAETDAHSFAHRRYYFEQAIRALEERNEMRRAVKDANTHLGTLVTDRNVLRFLIILARQANEPNIAAHYARLLTRLQKQ